MRGASSEEKRSADRTEILVVCLAAATTLAWVTFLVWAVTVALRWLWQ